MRIAPLLTSIKPESPLGLRSGASGPNLCVFGAVGPRVPAVLGPISLGRAGDEVMRTPAAVPACPAPQSALVELPSLGFWAEHRGDCCCIGDREKLFERRPPECRVHYAIKVLAVTAFACAAGCKPRQGDANQARATVGASP
jgi:hypothetical protein